MKAKDVKVAFFDTKPYDKKSFENVNKNYHLSLTFFDNKLQADTALMAEGFDVVCAFVNDEITKETIKVLVSHGVKLLAMRCAGYNNVDLKFAAECGLAIVRVPAYSPHAVAEYTLGLLLTLNRSIHRAFCRVRENNFSINGLCGFDLFGKTIGIIGTGKIGATFAELFKGFGVKILAYDLYPNKKLEEDLDLRYTTLDEIYEKSDIISLHCPLTKDNLHMINAQSIAKMRDGVIILNTSRGKLIDSKALIKALKTKKIGGAGLDVYEEESEYFFEDRSLFAIDDDVLARLLTFPNVLITSHQAFLTNEALANIAETTLNNISEYFLHNNLVNGVCASCAK